MLAPSFNVYQVYNTKIFSTREKHLQHYTRNYILYHLQYVEVVSMKFELGRFWLLSLILPYLWIVEKNAHDRFRRTLDCNSISHDCIC